MRPYFSEARIYKTELLADYRKFIEYGERNLGVNNESISTIFKQSIATWFFDFFHRLIHYINRDCDVSYVNLKT